MIDNYYVKQRSPNEQHCFPQKPMSLLPTVACSLSQLANELSHKHLLSLFVLPLANQRYPANEWQPHSPVNVIGSSFSWWVREVQAHDAILSLLSQLLISQYCWALMLSRLKPMQNCGIYVLLIQLIYLTTSQVAAHLSREGSKHVSNKTHVLL